MGKRAPAAPSAPDPYATASAQGGWNSFTAQQQQSMNMVNQNTPWGTLNYNQTGSTTMTDPSGKTIGVPQYTANVNLSDAQQSILDKMTAAQGSLASLASSQASQLNDTMGKPFSYTNDDAEKWAYDLGAKRLDPRFAQQEDQLRTQLVNSGIRPGTPAYEREMARMGESKNDAYNNLALASRGQSFNEALTTRNQPMNEMNALLTNSQVQNPTSSFAQTPQSQVEGVNYTGLVNQQYQGQLANWQAQQQAKQNAMGGLFGLGGSLISAGGQAKGFSNLFAMSDRRVKTDIRRVGSLYNGLAVYRYRMRGEGPFMIGVMADEVAEAIPEAVMEGSDGILRVRYDLATEAA